MDTGIKKTIYSTVNKHKENLISISEFIHQNPELCYEEYKAVSKLTGYLKKEGCVVKERFCGIDTSFISTHTVGNPKYHFAICAEYDALPKIGHACGHNIICTAALGAYLATKITMDKHGIEGKVSLIGTPAEEGGGGKIKIIDNGGFTGVDAAIMVHPTSGTTRIAGRCTTTHSFSIQYKGKSAHAASQPFKGINALDAANLFFNAIGFLRQQVTSDVRLSGYISEGGVATNMIPDNTKIEFSIRCLEENEMASLINRVKNCIEAASLATGCDVTIEEQKGYAARTFSETLGNICRESFEEMGEKLLPDFPDDFGSTDFGNVSQLMPTTNPYFSLNPTRVSLHTPEYEQLAISPISHIAIERSAKAMSQTIIECFTNPSLLDKAINEKKDSFEVNKRPR